MTGNHASGVHPTWRHPWLQAREPRKPFLVLTFCFVLVAAMSPYPMPLIRIVPTPAPYVIVLPALGACAIGSLADGPLDWAEALSARPTGRLLTCLIAVITATMSLGWLAVSSFTGYWGMSAMAIRNLIGYTGLSLIASRIAGNLGGIVVPALYAGLTGFLGMSGTMLWWPISQPQELGSWTIAATLHIVGILLTTPRGAQIARAMKTIDPI